MTYGDGSHQQSWAVASDTGGKAEVLGNSFVGPTDCTGYGGPYCIYPWFSKDRGGAINYGVDYPEHGKGLRPGEPVRADAVVPGGQPIPQRPDLLRHDPQVTAGLQWWARKAAPTTRPRNNSAN